MILFHKKKYFFPLRLWSDQKCIIDSFYDNQLRPVQFLSTLISVELLN